ncbi:3-hydroxyacyl-ACP dehydratase FabZ family protein [Streptomyces sp. NPDC001843]|uniref:3-hydroxyacyl-ACP dehydratase FabZ family protein n=1 Tax=Streptomyces sp. NPDC001843 TaxID=3364617 RepID=UPI0036A6E2B8
MLLEEARDPAKSRPQTADGPPEAASAEEVVRGRVSVPPDDPFLAGHYPGFPLVPGFSLVQYVYDLAAGAGAPRDHPVVVQKARFLSPVRPGEELVIEARIERSEGGVRAVASVSADARPAAEISLHYPQESA